MIDTHDLQGFLMNELVEWKIVSKLLEAHNRLHLEMSKEMNTHYTHIDLEDSRF